MTHAATQKPLSEFETVSHREIINRAGGPAKVSEAISEAGAVRNAPPVGRETVKGWARNDSIPGPYYQDFVDANLATLEELSAAAAAKRVNNGASETSSDQQ